MSRYLGIDYGTRRIGIAISDGLGLTARPLSVVPRAELEDFLRGLVEEYPIDLVVVGLPTALGGHEGESASGARQLADEVGEILGVPVELVDERFTSRMAEDALLESGMRRRQRKETVDKVASAIILQTFLDRKPGTGNSGTEPGVQSPGNT
ncbi:MAG TPA: Holliday junction resolvase RuvX [Acidimicrobiia bacterium]|nr:Holliday junction resolvase RuvX [Acidimicrobiia bacterium]